MGKALESQKRETALDRGNRRGIKMIRLLLILAVTVVVFEEHKVEGQRNFQPSLNFPRFRSSKRNVSYHFYYRFLCFVLTLYPVVFYSPYLVANRYRFASSSLRVFDTAI